MNLLRRELGGVQHPAAGVAVGYRHRLRAPVDPYVPEVEIVVGRCGVETARRRCLLEHDLRPERRIECVGAEAAGMDRAGDELVEWQEIVERGLLWIVAMRGAIVHVGGQPGHVTYVLALDE